ncbi:hypothetical protein C8R46DRAFT_1025105 [Mycena filopes]|nr:hypothetical protein C8R46DRAFT_1025105 [Mycena filopes]
MDDIPVSASQLLSSAALTLGESGGSRPAAGTPNLPFDVLSRVFNFVVGTVWWNNTTIPYGKALFRLCHVNIHWGSVCLGCGWLWASLKINRSTNLDFLVFQLQTAGLYGLHIHLDLFHSGVLPVGILFDIVLDQAARLETLYVLVGSAENADEIASEFSRTTFTSLKSLRLECGPRDMRRSGSPSFSVDGRAPAVRAIRMRRVWFPFDGMPDFSRLRFLVIRDIVIRCAPTMSDWGLIQQTAVCLERLAILNVGCKDVTVAFRRLYFPALKHLDVGFTRRTPGLFELVRCLHVPNLNYLAMYGTASSTVQCVFHDTSNTLNLQHLVLGISCLNAADGEGIFRSVPRLRTLDVREADSVVLVALGSGSATEDHLCRGLTELMLSSASTGQVKSFLEQRTQLRNFSLNQVVFRQRFDASTFDEDDLDWLGNDSTITRLEVRDKPRYLSELQFGTDFTFSEEAVSPSGALVSRCVQFPLGAPILVRVIGLLHNVTANDNYTGELLVLRSPDDCLPTAKLMYDTQSLVLLNALRKSEDQLIEVRQLIGNFLYIATNAGCHLEEGALVECVVTLQRAYEPMDGGSFKRAHWMLARSVAVVG